MNRSSEETGVVPAAVATQTANAADWTSPLLSTNCWRRVNPSSVNPVNKSPSRSPSSIRVRVSFSVRNNYKRCYQHGWTIEIWPFKQSSISRLNIQMRFISVSISLQKDFFRRAKHFKSLRSGGWGARHICSSLALFQHYKRKPPQMTSGETFGSAPKHKRT